MKTVLAICLVLSLCCVCLAGTIKGASSSTSGRKGRVVSPSSDEDTYSASLIKMPRTLTTSASRHSPIIDDPDYHQVSLDPHHVAYVMENRMYYHRIPHQRLVLHYEDIRELNGLPRHLLESIRPFFPFYVEY